MCLGGGHWYSSRQWTKAWIRGVPAVMQSFEYIFGNIKWSWGTQTILSGHFRWIPFGSSGSKNSSNEIWDPKIPAWWPIFWPVLGKGYSKKAKGLYMNELPAHSQNLGKKAVKAHLVSLSQAQISLLSKVQHLLQFILVTSAQLHHQSNRSVHWGVLKNFCGQRNRNGWPASSCAQTADWLSYFI